MTFLGRRHAKYRFKASFEACEISAVPFASGVYFLKIRLLDGGNFEGTSRRCEIANNRVVWNEIFSFDCKVIADGTTRILDNCRCRVSFRRETKGGRGREKLGYADVNLSEHAKGSGSSTTDSKGSPITATTASYLLQGYESEQRLANSILKVRVDMTLIAGDLMYKAAPTSTTGCRIPDGFEREETKTLSSSLTKSFSLRIPFAGSLRDMWQRDHMKKKTEWYYPSLFSEGEVVKAVDSKETMAEVTPNASTLGLDGTLSATPTLMEETAASASSQSSHTLSDHPPKDGTPERPPRRKHSAKSHSRQTSGASSVSGYSSLHAGAVFELPPDDARSVGGWSLPSPISPGIKSTVEGSDVSMKSSPEIDDDYFREDCVSGGGSFASASRLSAAPDALKSRGEIMRETRVSSDAVVDELLLGGGLS